MLWLLAEGAQDVLCITTRALVPLLLERLRRFVLRAKVTLTDESALAPLSGWMGRDAGSALGALGLHFESAECGVVTRPAGGPVQPGALAAWRHPAGNRFMVLNATPDAMPAADASGDHDWRAADIAAGLPRLEPATSEAFVAQMLNLDVLEAVSFQKGCYTGQEVIARAHYRGRVKRRMQRFRTLAPVTGEWPAGLQGTFTDGRSFQVIDALRQADGSLRIPRRGHAGQGRGGCSRRHRRRRGCLACGGIHRRRIAAAPRRPARLTQRCPNPGLQVHESRRRSAVSGMSRNRAPTRAKRSTPSVASSCSVPVR